MDIKKQKILHSLVKFILPTIIAPVTLFIVFYGIDSINEPKKEIAITVFFIFLVIARVTQYFLNKWECMIISVSTNQDNGILNECSTHQIIKELFSKKGLIYFLWFILMVFIYIGLALVLPAFIVNQFEIYGLSENIIIGISWLVIFFIIRFPLSTIDNLINKKLGRKEKLLLGRNSMKLSEVFKMDENKLLNTTIFILIFFTIFLIYSRFINDRGYYYFTIDDENEIGKYSSYQQCIEDEIAYKENNFLKENESSKCDWKP